METEGILGAVYAKLAADGDVSSFAVSIGVEHPQDTDPANLSVFPYITFSASASNPFDDKDAVGETIVVQVTPWGRGTN
jgi:hypothetical protein